MRQPLWDFSLVGESRPCGAECVIPGVRSCSFYFWSCPEHKTTKHKTTKTTKTTTTKHQNLRRLSMLLEHGQVFCVVAGTKVKTCWFPLKANCCPQLQAPSAEAGLAARDPHTGCRCRHRVRSHGSTVLSLSIQAVAVAQACEVRKVLEHQAPLRREVLMLQPCPTSQGCPSPAVRCVRVDVALLSLFAGLLQPPACAAALCCTSERAAAFISSPCCGSVGSLEALKYLQAGREMERVNVNCYYY